MNRIPRRLLAPATAALDLLSSCRRPEPTVMLLPCDGSAGGRYALSGFRRKSAQGPKDATGPKPTGATGRIVGYPAWSDSLQAASDTPTVHEHS